MSEKLSNSDLEKKVLELEKSEVRNKELIESLQKSQKLYKNLFENMLHEVHVWEIIRDDSGDIKTWKLVDANPAALNSWGKTLEEVKGRTTDEIFNNIPATEYFLPVVKKIFAENKPHIWESFFPGTNQILHMISIPFGNYFLSTGLDVTEQKHMEQALSQNQKMEAIGALAGGLAHDFNNILGVFAGNVSYVLKKAKLSGDETSALADVLEGVKNGRALTQQLITFSKGGEPIKQVIQPNDVMRKSCKLYLSGSSSKSELNLDEDLWNIEADENQLNQVFSNIIINAEHAMPEGGIIRIRSENVFIEENYGIPLPPGKYVLISFADEGTGIPEKYLSKVFEPFFSTKKKGSGLGLSTAFSIIKKHKGHVSIDSNSGEGTLIKIYLPVTDKNIDNVEASEEIDFTGKGKILIMDDQEIILKMAKRMLEEMGFETDFATNGADAIEIYKKSLQDGKPFDLVILDLTIPGGMGGAKTIPELLKIDPKVKAMVSSGYSNDPIMSNFEDYGFCGVIPKPYTMAQISDALKKFFLKT